MAKIKDKIALVTGAADGIGLAIAKRFASEGAKVAMVDIQEKKCVEEARAIESLGGEVRPISCDVGNSENVSAAVEETIEHFGTVDIMCNNAAIALGVTITEMSEEDWNKVIEINLTGAFLCSKAVYPNMKTRGSGKIINIGSMTSIFGLDWAVAYASSKGGIVQLTKTLAVSWAKDGIQANSILPGWIHTDLTQGIKDNFQNRYDHILSRIPEGRWGEPGDLSGTAVFLASSASDYVTGVSIPVDGGYTSF